MKTDVIVIGGGPGGYECAIRLRQYGKQVILVEKQALGGTCLNQGCIPTKTVLQTSGLYRRMQSGNIFGLKSQDLQVDFSALRNRKEQISGQLRDGIAALLKANGVTVINGTGFIPEPGIVDVTDTDGTVTRHTADHIVAAVGSRPVLLPIPGAELEGVYTSDRLLEELPELKRLTIIGGGVIGVEMACAYSELGTQVTILEAAERILPQMDRDVAQHLGVSLKKQGVAIHTGVSVSRIRKSDQMLSCDFTSAKGAAQSVEAEAVLLSVGRCANTDRVFSENLGICLKKGRAVVDDSMLAVPGIYVIGDASFGYPQLAHAASAQGLAVAAAIAGRPCETDLHLVPSCVYTSPEIASVGLTEAEAKASGIPVHIGKFLMGGNGKSLICGEERGFVKLLADDSGKLAGALLYCAHATDMISELTLAISRGLSIEQVVSIIRPHPTVEEAIGEAADCIQSLSIHTPPKRK